MKNYKLLTPGPLTTTETVKKEMLFDHCTWDDDYKQITLDIRKKLLELAHVSEEEYTVVLMQGSGTFGVEAVLTSVVGDTDKLLIIANGAYGERMEEIGNMPDFHMKPITRCIIRCRMHRELTGFWMRIRRLPMSLWYTVRQPQGF